MFKKRENILFLIIFFLLVMFVNGCSNSLDSMVFPKGLIGSSVVEEPAFIISASPSCSKVGDSQIVVFATEVLVLLPELESYEVYRCEGFGCMPTEKIAGRASVTELVDGKYIDVNIPQTAITKTYRYKVKVFDAEDNEYVSSISEPVTTIPKYNAEFISQTEVPENIVTDQYFTVDVIMKNTGCAIWSSEESYRLGSQNPRDNLIWGIGRVNLKETVNKGEETTFTIEVRAPSKPGNYNFMWQMLQEYVRWFGEATQSTVIKVIIEVNCTDSDGGRNYYVKGTATSGNYSATDYCLDDGKLKEFYCSDVDGTVDPTVFSCPSEYVCDDGACREEEQKDLIAYYPFNGDANDESGNGNDGVVHGATLITDRNGTANSAYYFDGVDDYIDLGTDLGINGSFTLMSWVKFNSVGTAKIIVGRGDYYGDCHNYWLATNTAKPITLLGGFCNTSSPLSYSQMIGKFDDWDINKWYHVAFVYDSLTELGRFYINGSKDKTHSISGSPFNMEGIETIIGAARIKTGFAGYFNGAIDEVKIYDRALSEEEIRANMREENCFDLDEDGYGVCPNCGITKGCSYDGDDCNDYNFTVNPGATEICNEVDDDCDGEIDEGVEKRVYYRDYDHDVYGDPLFTRRVCSMPGGYINNNFDCDDYNSKISPGATEICSDGIDNNCNNESDYDSQDGRHGDENCAVGVTDISVTSFIPIENTNINVSCVSTARSVNSVSAYIDSSLCNFVGWDIANFTNFTYFTCNVGSIGTKTVKCTIDSLKSYQSGPDQTIVINVQPTPCSSYSKKTDCDNDADCEWCPQCSGTKYSFGSDRCVDKGRCSYYCWRWVCGAECDLTQGGCEVIDCDYLDGCYNGTYRDYYDVEQTCRYDCACTSYECSSYREIGSCVECSDGIDNDNDGKTDWIGADTGCDTIFDDDETDCGDGVCEGGETCSSCSVDCACSLGKTCINGECIGVGACIRGGTACADYDTDGNIDTDDFLQFANCYGSDPVSKPNCFGNPPPIDFDYNDDKDIDENDFGCFTEEFGSKTDCAL